MNRCAKSIDMLEREQKEVEEERSMVEEKRDQKHRKGEGRRETKEIHGGRSTYV